MSNGMEGKIVIYNNEDIFVIINFFWNEFYFVLKYVKI